MDQQVVENVELYFAGHGNDLINLADPVFTLNELNIFGSHGNDILWGNVENDLIFGEQGDDHLVGGPGDDILVGGSDNDYLGGGFGSDIYAAGIDEDIIKETADDDLNYIYAPSGLTKNDLSYTLLGNDLLIEFADMWQVTIVDQFAASNSGIDAIVLEDGTGETIDLRAMFVLEPSAICLILPVILATVARRERPLRGVPA